MTTARTIELIVGRKIEETMRWRPRTVPPTRPAARGSRSRRRPAGATARPSRSGAGEIVGLAGLMGSGRTELAHALFGIQRIESGDGPRPRARASGLRSPRAAIDAGIALVPEDRRVQGLVLDHSVRTNLTITLLRTLSDARRDAPPHARRSSHGSSSHSLSITSWALPRPARLLSGGNQQKVVIAKWLGRDPDILVMDEPTAGIDVGTKAEIIEIIRRLADAGKAVIADLVGVRRAARRRRPGPDHPGRRRRGGALDRKDIAGEEELHALLQAA